MAFSEQYKSGPIDPPLGELFLMVRRKTTTMFLDIDKEATVTDLKKVIQGILKVKPEDQQLMDVEEGSHPFTDSKPLSAYGIVPKKAKSQSPKTLGLVLRDETGEFEALDITPYSEPPPLPEETE